MTSCLYCHSQSPSGATFCCRACEILYGGNFSNLSHLALQQKKGQWAVFDQEEVRQLYRQNSSDNREVFRFYIEGLQCASCVHLLEKLPEFHPQIESAQVFFGNSELVVQVQKNVPLSDIFSMIQEMGYGVHLLKTDETSQDHWQQDTKKWLKEIAVAGACTGNIMMFIVPVYAGVSGTYKTAFLWLSFVLFLPILIYSAQSIYSGAWRALKTRTLNTDVALTLALWMGFLLSTLNLLRGSDNVYFDSTASFLFLILVSRYFVKKVQRQTLIRLQKPEDFWGSGYLRKKQNAWQETVAPLLQVGDEILLKRDQILPCDSLLLSSQSEWDSSLMTGEVLPRVYNRGLKVHAGYRLLSPEVYVQVTDAHDKSELQKMLHLISQQSLKKSQFVLKMDLWSQRLLICVFGLGLLFFGFYSTIDLEGAFQRVLALWIVACPCALAFAAPLTLYKALHEARKKGLLVKNPDVFEKAKNVQELIFDKTGTLTTGHLELVLTHPAPLSQYYKDIVLELEKNSCHPVAFGFRKAWPEGPRLSLQLTDVYEKIGEKVYGLLDGKMYTLRSASGDTLNLKVVLLENNQIVAQFEFQDELYTDTKNTVAKLKANFQCSLLSGDRQDRVFAMAQTLNIPKEQAWFEQTPLAKWQHIKNHPQAMMLGDGANDAAALQEALIGVATHGSLEMSFQVADIYLMKKGLQPLLSFFSISDRYQMILKRNFVLAVTYNLVAGVCALLGLINPLIAALLMPLSSLFLLFSTLEGWS